MTREKWSLLAVTLIAVAMIVGGCTRSDQHKAADRPTATATTPSPTPSPTATSTTSSSTTKAGTTGAITCRTTQLKVRLAQDPGGGAAGSRYSHLTFTNTGSRTCTMTGWPGVSYVGSGNGTQLGSPAVRTGSAKVIDVKPGATAEALLKESAAGNYSADCIIRPADGLRVYPPNNTAAVFVPHTIDACAANAVHLMTIGPVQLK